MSDSPKESHCHCSCHDPALSGFSCVHCKRVAISTESPITRDELREMFQKNSAVSNAFSFSPAKFEECLDLILQELDKAVEGAYKKGYIQGGHDEMQKTEQFWTKQPFPDDGATTMFIHDRFTQLKKQLKSVTTSNERGNEYLNNESGTFDTLPNERGL